MENKIRALSEEILGMKHRLAHFMNCEVSDESLKPLRDSIQEKQTRLLEMIGDSNESNNEK
ncbi:MAG: hypothetical protein HUU50_02485 [Candidatus Brocadiae bacterium]|nr:hypothetical protein [Candidatus Brocadiia bacterium]